MLTGNVLENHTACGDAEAEELLTRILSEIGEQLSDIGLSVYLGGSYGRGEGGVREDRQNGILYNDLDFFVFSRNSVPRAGELLHEISEKYEKELKVDIDFSRVMSVQDIRKNAQRLMMQELKRGYRLVCGEDLLTEFLPEINAEDLLFSEACRLLLNRGMGLLLAGEKISSGSADTDFILRNLCKAVLGSGDAVLISEGRYRWKIRERLALVMESDFPEEWKRLYADAVEFKRAPHRKKPSDINVFWQNVRDFYRSSVLRCAGTGKITGFQDALYAKFKRSGELSLKNFLKYSIKTKSFPLCGWKKYMAPAVAIRLDELYIALEEIPRSIDRTCKLYQHWLIFN